MIYREQSAVCALTGESNRPELMYRTEGGDYVKYDLYLSAAFDLNKGLLDIEDLKEWYKFITKYHGKIENYVTTLKKIQILKEFDMEQLLSYIFNIENTIGIKDYNKYRTCLNKYEYVEVISKTVSYISKEVGIDIPSYTLGTKSDSKTNLGIKKAILKGIQQSY